MDLKLIKKLTDLMKREGLKTLEISDKEQKIFLVKDDGRVRVPVHPEQEAPEVLDFTPKAGTATAARTGAKSGHEVKSPLVGVFYAAPAPDAAPYVQVGTRVRAGDVLCIVEAMKQMNEIAADRDGEVVDIVVANGDIVEYDQVLFVIK
jgi:acetyl-CoA carboxylase biotin carboxyl carrier protein